jgi:LPXTG-site transpeptidase (sortase) family protein
MIDVLRKSLPGLLILIVLLAVPVAAAQDEVSVQIPILNVDSPLAEFRMGRSTWRISPWARGIGHLEGTGWFGSATNTVLAAHSELPGSRPGIFADLHTLVAGDEILVQAAGSERRYLVSEVINVALDEVNVVYPTDHERLTLITSETASFDPESQLYERRVVVIAYPG